MKKMYYKAMKKGFESKVPQVIIVDLDMNNI